MGLSEASHRLLALVSNWGRWNGLKVIMGLSEASHRLLALVSNWGCWNGHCDKASPFAISQLATEAEHQQNLQDAHEALERLG